MQNSMFLGVYNHLHFNSIKSTLKTFFSKKESTFAFLPKNCEVKDNCSETPLNYCPLKELYRQKVHFNFKHLALGQKKSEFENGQLEFGFSISEKVFIYPSQSSYTRCDCYIPCSENPITPRFYFFHTFSLDCGYSAPPF